MQNLLYILSSLAVFPERNFTNLLRHSRRTKDGCRRTCRTAFRGTPPKEFVYSWKTNFAKREELEIQKLQRERLKNFRFLTAGFTKTNRIKRAMVPCKILRCASCRIEITLEYGRNVHG